MWVKRAASHPQELRQGKKITSSANTEMPNISANTSKSAEEDDSTLIPSYIWKPIIGNNFVEDVNYNKFDEKEVKYL